jgi:hypothetical protein
MVDDPSEPNYERFVCLFCATPIEPGLLDPCALNLTACIDRPEHLWKDQTFFCHLHCLQSRAATHPGNFYIAEPDFATRGEIEAERDEGDV